MLKVKLILGLFFYIFNFDCDLCGYLKTDLAWIMSEYGEETVKSCVMVKE